MQIIDLGSRIVNNYIFPITDGYMLIDTGYEHSFSRFKKKLDEKNISVKGIRYVFLTHAHDDHAGFLNEVLRHTDAKVILHPKAIEGLERGQNSFDGGCSTRRTLLFCKLMAILGKGEHRFPQINREFEERFVTSDCRECSDIKKIWASRLLKHRVIQFAQFHFY